MDENKNIFHGYLKDENIEEFNRKVGKLTDPVDLAGCNLRGLDLRGADLSRADLRNSYLKFADLRGIDFSEAQLEGASIHDAHIGGALFPKNLDASEILLSVQYGARMRTRN